MTSTSARMRRLLVSAACALGVLAGSAAPAAAQQPPGPGAPTVPLTATAGTAAAAAAVLGEGFVLAGEWVASGVVWLDWDDIDDAAAYELMYRGADGWALLSQDAPVGGAAVRFEGSSARVAGLSADVGEYWFAVRARNAFGVSVWSDSARVAVPEYALEVPGAEPLFDPFTAPTRSGIDLERLREAVATIAPGDADCTAAPALTVAGVTVVDRPIGLDDPDVELAVAEVARVAGGCLLVEYVALEGRSVAQVRELLAEEDSVLAVGAPVRGARIAHDGGAHSSHGTTHHDDGDGEQWHLPQPTMNKLWTAWEPDRPVIVAVLDTGVDEQHPDLDDRIVTGGLEECHRRDPDGHGTHVAGIVAAEHHDPPATNQHVAGVAPGAQILPLRVLERAGCDPAMQATEAVAAAVNNGARVINMSLIWSSGHRSEDDQNVGGIPIDRDVTSDTFELALRAASMLGVVSVAAAGNCGNDEEVTVDGETKKSWEHNKCSGHNFDHAPAIYATTGDVITVAAINRNGERRESSTANEHVDIAAPGGGILSTDRCTNIGPPAHRVVSCGTALRSGTSMAAPFVAGVVAHMLNRYPSATAGQVRNVLFRSASRDLPIDYPNHDYGHGIVDPVEAVARLGGIIEAEAADAGGFVEVDAGARHSCGRRASGRVRCWGDNGVAANTPVLEFDQVSVPTGPADHACGVTESPVAVRGSRRVEALCWSSSGRGVPQVVQGALEQVVAGFAQSCGLRPDGSVVCWDNDTGAGRHAPDGMFEEVSGGWLHFCGLRADGSVQCWGDNAHGQSDAPAGVAFVSVDAGGSHSCGVTAGRGVRCWGAAGALAGMPAATQTGFLTVDAGHGHSCAIALAGLGQEFPHGSGRVTCWGDDAYGQAGAPGEGFVQVSAGWRHSCGRRPDATVVCWGSDSNGQAPQARLSSLSLMPAGGAELISFDPAVTDYTVVAEPGEATLARTVADHGTSGPESTDPTPPDFKPGTGEHEVMLADGLVIEVSVEALFGFGESRTYRINIVERPRLASLSVAPAGSDCMPVCAPLALDPAFDSDVFDYTVLAPADLSRVTVAYTEVGGRAAVAPDDADGAVAGYQVALSTDRGFAAVAAGSSHSCGVKTDGTVACWGANRSGQSDAPSGSFVAVAAGWSHSCGVKTGGSVVCWGANGSGQSDAPAGSFRSVAAGSSHSCGVKTDGSVVCWGANGSGQSDAPAGSFRSVAAGSSHSCGVRTDGSVVCWGFNGSGQTNAPAGSFVAVAAGRSHSCGVRTGGSVVCWGADGSGRSNAPTGSFVAVAAGSSHSCGVRIGGSVVCWGDNDSGQSDAPGGVFGGVAAGSLHSCGLKADAGVVCWGVAAGRADAPGGSFAAVAAGDLHSCGVKADRSAICWGNNRLGQSDAPAGSFSAVTAGEWYSCGLGTGGGVACWGYEDSFGPGEDNGLLDAPSGSFSAVSAGRTVACGIKADQSIVCWGSNSYGQSEAPSGSFSAVAAGAAHACAIRTDRSAVCWGLGRLDRAKAPAGSFSAVAAGEWHSCGIRTDGAVVCWGWDIFGVLDVPAGAFTAIALGAMHACGINTSGSVECWGNDAAGQLEAPAGAYRSIAAGWSHSCGIRTDQTIVCWGARSPVLEPAAPAEVTLEVANRSAPALAARYEVALKRPRPVLEPAPDAVRGSSGSPGDASRGQRSGERPPQPECRDTWACDDAGPVCIPLTRWCLDLPPQGPPHTAAPGNSDPAASPATSPTAAAASSVVCPAHNAPDGAVAVADSVLRAAIERTLNKAPGSAVTAAEMAELTSLEVPADGAQAVSSLAGLQHATGLTTLSVTGHDVSSLQPLSCLSGLTTVDVSNNEISDISALSAHSALTALDLSGNDIADIASLSQLSGLRSLNLGRNQIIGLGPLRGLSSLERLHLYDNQITDPAPLADLSRLTTLHLDHNQITDVSALSGLTSLAVLGLGDNSIADIAPLRSLTGLETLYVFDNDLVDASALAALGGLGVLWIDGNDIAGPYRVPRLGGLGYLDARHNLVSDVAPLDAAAAPEATVHREPQRVTTIHISDPGLRSVLLAATGRAPGEALDADEVAAIERLDVTAVELGGLSELRALRSLRRLNLHHNSLNGLDGLPALGGLDTLFVDFNNIDDLNPLTALRGLRSLGLVGNNIADLEPLAALTGLESLYLSANNITDLTALTGLRRLHHLRLTTNNIADLEPLKELAALTQLHLRHNNITSLEPLKELTALTYLDLRDNNITSLEPLAGLTRLQDLHIGGNHITDYSPLDHLTALTIHGHDHQTPTN